MKKTLVANFLSFIIGFAVFALVIKLAGLENVLGAVDDVAVMVLAIDVFLDGLPEGLVAEKLVQLGIPPSDLESDLARVRRVVPRPLRALIARIPGALDRIAERIAETGIDQRLREALQARAARSEGIEA